MIAKTLFGRFSRTRRLRQLRQDMERFRDSQFAQFPEKSLLHESARSDEATQLRDLFLQLAAQMRAQMQLQQRTHEMRRELLGHISHDLRTPLTTLLAHLETLSLKEDLSAQERRSYLGVALAQCRRLGKLIEQSLELAKLESGQAAFSPEPFQVAELAHDVAQNFELAAKRAEVTLQVEHPEFVPLVLGDIRLIELVLNNLLENALQCVSAGGRVSVRILPQGASVRVEVRDSGPGIPVSERHRVFEGFYRGDKSRSTQSGYSGLGLAIVRGILELHGQAVDLVSLPNQGTTFFFELAIVGGGGAIRRAA